MKNIIRALLPASLILLFIYAAASKLADFHYFKGELYNQAFPHAVADVLLFAIPAAELLAVALLLFERGRLYGLGLSLLLMVLFTGYIALVKLHFWPRVPCSCGGILSHMSWTAHLIFNCAFLLVSIGALWSELREQRGSGG